MAKLHILMLPAGREGEFEPGVSPLEVARTLDPERTFLYLASRFGGELRDLSAPIGCLPGDSVFAHRLEVQFYTFDNAEGRHVYRHSSAHVLAQAVQRLFPGTKLAIGPAIDDGFYYDFDTDHTFTPEDFMAIEAEIQGIIDANFTFVREELSRSQALALFAERDEAYKQELIQDLPEDAVISIYRQGDYVDLCTGPHLPSTGYLGAVKVLGVAGAYWRGNERNKMLQRLYGTSFPGSSQLREHLERLEEARKRDHRKLGQALGLFAIEEEGPGFPFFHPKGIVLRNQLENFWRQEHCRWGYQEIKTPIILHRSLWECSGHWDHYKENMYFTRIDDQEYAIKPMNCPGALLVYRAGQHSYRELPLRLAELGLVHRHEKSGVLHGLLRVRAFTQDDAHIFMTMDQVAGEIKGVIDLVDYFYTVFGFSYRVELSTRPGNAMGSLEVWDLATGALRQALEEKGLEYQVNEGDGAFYGPKIDFHLRDSLGRTWQCGTIQLDFLMPEKFDLSYIGPDGEKHRPVMIHRVVFGSIERFIGILTEHYGGVFPTWLAPVQVKLLPIADRHHEYSLAVAEKLIRESIRAEVDRRNEKVGHKIREAQLEKIPYMLVIGDKEQSSGSISVRHRVRGDLGIIDPGVFLADLKEEIASKS